ncbi:MAG: hypothetical protein J1G04_05220 [Clostridiales bacterium]|nr:hypothetical protein [Clostridiales bacterium]
MEEHIDNEITAIDGADTAATENTAAPTTKKKRKRELSGAYWYTETDDELKKQSFIRTLITVIAFMLQLVVLVLPQGSLGYVTEHIPSYAYVYMWFVFVMFGVSIYVIVMNMTRYKLLKRIPVERAPKHGFKRRSFFGAELLIATYAVIFVLELSFVCISFDGFGLTGMFVSLLSVAAAVWARQVTVLTLRDATLIPAPTAEQTDSETE